MPRRGIEWQKRPEKNAGGFARDDGTIEFYTRVKSLTTREAWVLDLGAGRGRGAEDTIAFRADLVAMKGKVGRIIGADVDAAVFSNPMTDQAVQIFLDKPLPFADQTFDLALCDWVLEHVEDVAFFADEIWRVLKPQGWFCARTINRFGYVGIAAQLLGSRFQERILAFAQPERQGMDVFPKRYKANTMKAIDRFFPPSRFENYSYYYNPEPAYHAENKLFYSLIDAFQKLAPQSAATCLFAFLKKIG